MTASSRPAKRDYVAAKRRHAGWTRAEHAAPTDAMLEDVATINAFECDEPVVDAGALVADLVTMTGLEPAEVVERLARALRDPV